MFAVAAHPGRQKGSFGMENREMASLFNPRRLASALTLAAGALVIGGTAVEAQGARMRVLVTNFEAADGTRSRMGERIANDLKRHINQMPTHAAAEDRPINDALRRFGLNRNNMNCIEWRQLAQQVDVGLVLCGTVDEQTNQVRAEFFPVAGGDGYEVPSFTMSDPGQAAQHVVEAFGNFTRQLSLVVFCTEDLESQNWTSALDRCNQAVELNPRSIAGHYGRGSALAQLDRPEEALQAFERVLEIDPMNDDAMLHAGLLTARLGRSEESQRYFASYLELNPGSEEVRLKIATDLNNAGDPMGALRLLEEVINAGDASGLVKEYAGHMAMNAGLRRMEAGPANGTQDEAQRFFRTAVQHYAAAMQARGDSIDATVYRNLMLAHSQLGNSEEALRYGQQATQRNADDAQTWMVYADALQKAGRLDQALQAFDRVSQINPETPNISIRKAQMLLEANRVQDAVAVARQGRQSGNLSPDHAETLAQQIAVRGFNATQAGRHAEALPLYAAAREIGQSQRTAAMINFFNGFTLLRQAHPLLSENANAARARQARPMVEQAKTLLEGAGAYTEQASQRATLIQQANQLLEVADALIRAGR
jgi:tetratricopeptide (TPR) repeat protein